MSKIAIRKYRLIHLLPIETMVIITSYSFITQKTQIKNPFDPILGLGLVKDF